MKAKALAKIAKSIRGPLAIEIWSGSGFGMLVEINKKHFLDELLEYDEDLETGYKIEKIAQKYRLVSDTPEKEDDD